MAQHIILNGNVQEGIPSSKKVDLPNMFSMDMAQSRFFTVELGAPNKSKNKISTFKGMEGLPVKNISYTVTGIETMTLPIGVFRDLPIPIGKKLPTITLTLLDSGIDQIEMQLRDWFESMIPSSKNTISYLDDMVGTLKYKSYDTSGNPNYTYTANVMLTEDLSISRDYEANELKSLQINLIVLKDEVTVGDTSKPLEEPKPVPEIASQKQEKPKEVKEAPKQKYQDIITGYTPTGEPIYSIKVIEQ